MAESDSNSPARGKLTSNQWRLLGAAVAVLSVTVIAFFILGIFTLLRDFIATFSDVLWPLAVAGILAMIFRPFVVFLQRRAKFSRTWAIVTLFLVAALLLAGALLIVVPTLVDQTVRFIEYLPDLFQSLRTALAENYPKVVEFANEKIGQENLQRIQTFLTDSVSVILSKSETAIANLGGFVSRIIAIGTGLAIIPVYLFFMLESRRNLIRDLKKQLSFIRDDWRDDILFLTEEFVGSVVSFFRGQIIIAFIMGVLLALGFMLIDLNFAIILGLAIGFLNIIPYLGSIIGLGIALPLAYFQKDGGGIELLLFAIGVFVAVQMIEGYLLTPRIMGKTTGLHPMVIIIAIFFWGTALNGVLGMILAIPLTAFFVVAWRLAKRKYLDHLRNSRTSDASE
ncbi:AI-2E family transporter [Pelagicoccus sp. SDUM812003]|uniref:AI-2E family transporter n=1 Tax=Pelagicoccus sp. SDUM812003 TaxID=3041267 RepID=UPI00280EC153|nr:AI-2E family transporter [Pelagicoccus sp. SDUM812003]MDQ8204889.1 AI-2E family transporter [Pelagicoccus sp. SDUM812003]